MDIKGPNQTAHAQSDLDLRYPHMLRRSNCSVNMFSLYIVADEQIWKAVSAVTMTNKVAWTVVFNMVVSFQQYLSYLQSSFCMFPCIYAAFYHELYENKPIQIYWKFYNQNRKIFR